METRSQFYKKIVKKEIISLDSSILICGGGDLDKSVFLDIGFKNVTISNLDTRVKIDDFLPYKWAFENAENLSFKDHAFDYVVIHAAVHHASRPHQVILEMYRVAKKGVLIFESRDSILMRLLEILQITQTYEHAAVHFNNGDFGGQNNTNIPNYVFRWTEREIEKLIQTFSPYYKHIIRYNYGSAFPCTPELEEKGQLKKLILHFLKPFYWIFSKIFVKQQNMFSILILKDIEFNNIFPWLKYNKKMKKITFNKNWSTKKYKQYQN